MFGFFRKVRELESGVKDLKNLVNEHAPLIDEGVQALVQVKELRERVWPLFAQGAEANQRMIEKVGNLPG